MFSYKTALKVILVIGVAGLLFSGYLSYNELFVGSCPFGCGKVGGIFGIPVCVFGFTMYLLIVATAIGGLTYKGKNEN